MSFESYVIVKIFTYSENEWDFIEIMILFLRNPIVALYG